MAATVISLKDRIDTLAGRPPRDVIAEQRQIIEQLQADLSAVKNTVFEINAMLATEHEARVNVQTQLEREQALHAVTEARMQDAIAGRVSAEQTAAKALTALDVANAQLESERSARERAEVTLQAERNRPAPKPITSTKPAVSAPAAVVPRNFTVRITGRDMNGDATAFDIQGV